MRQDCSTCPAKNQCWSNWTELNLLACRVRFGEDVEQILRVLLPELKMIIRMVLTKRRANSTTPEHLYSLIFESLRDFDPAYEMSPLTRLFSRYNGVITNDIRAEKRYTKNLVPLSQADDVAAPEPEPAPDQFKEQEVEAALRRVHDGVTLTSREFRMLYAWLYGTVPYAQLAAAMSITRQDGHTLVASALLKIQNHPSVKSRYLADLLEGTPEEAAVRLGKKPSEIKAARARLERGSKPRARAGTPLAAARANIDIFKGRAVDVAKQLGCSERRVYAMRTAQRKAHAARSPRRST